MSASFSDFCHECCVVYKKNHPKSINVVLFSWCAICWGRGEGITVNKVLKYTHIGVEM